MNNEEIIRMALEAGGYLADLPKGDAWMFNDNQQLERFAALVAAHEREACAKVCDEHGLYGAAPARDIRARGDK